MSASIDDAITSLTADIAAHAGVPEAVTRKRRHAGWIKVHTETVAGTRWWRVQCLIEHEPNTVSRWWQTTAQKAWTSALEHLAGHAVKKVPLKPFEEVGDHDV